jgi:hypothetical protein
MLSISTADDDIRRSYELHVNCYLVKPVRFDEFMNVMQVIEGSGLPWSTCHHVEPGIDITIRDRTAREKILGRSFFEVFPDNSDDPAAGRPRLGGRTG